MTLSAVSGAASWDAPPVDGTGTAHSKNVQVSTSDAPPNAFAASLAAMLGPRHVAAPKDDKSAAISELNASLKGMSAEPTVAGPVGAGGGSALSPSAALVSEARAGASGASVTTANSETDALNPDFRARLGRVITRMSAEYGHDVELVEGFRPQARQEFLYEQGRTRPGDVVTWTKSSKHTLGLAADVKIDGSYDKTVAYQHLAQIAAQEGLRTLGARDPGHVELPNRGGAAAWGSLADITQVNENVSRAVGLALAQGNPAARDVTPADGDVHALNGFLSRMSHVGATAPVTASQQSGSRGGSASNGFGHQQHRSSDGNTAQRTITGPAHVASVADAAQIAHVADVAQVAHPGASSARVDGAPMVAQGDAAERVGRMLDVRDATPAQPLSHMTLDLDNASGGTDRITVQLRGGAVDTAISLGDANKANRMSLRVGELQHALEHHGLNASSIRVGSTATDSGAGWTPRRESDQDAHQGQPSPNYRDNRQDADEARQRSRKEQQGEKQK